MYRVEEWNRNDAGTERFIEFAHDLYKDDPFYRPSSLPPEGSRLFLVCKGDQIISRGAVCFNPDITLHEKKTALLGWYESLEDMEASNLLLQHVEAYSRENRAEVILGPLDHDTSHQYRLALPSDAPPFFLDRYHKPWYTLQFIDRGWAPIETYHSSRLLLQEGEGERVPQFVERFQRRGVTFRPMNIEKFDEEIALIHHLSIEAFQINPFYTPTSLQEMHHLYQPLQRIIDPSLILIAESSEGETLGFVFTVPDLYEPDPSSLIVKTVAAKPGPEARGLGTLLIEMMHRQAKQKGYRWIIHALMHDSNASANIKKDRFETIREYVLYGKELQENTRG